MLPDLKVVVCGIAFCILLFVAAGSVTLPESRTHVGEIPELARPMMQESIAETPEAPPLFAMIAVPGDGAGLREAAPGTAGVPAGADASDADNSDADGPGAEISGAAPSPHDPRGDPLRELLDSLRDEPPATAGPPSPAGGGVRDRALPPRRAIARGRRHVPSVVQHHGYMRGAADAVR